MLGVIRFFGLVNAALWLGANLVAFAIIPRAVESGDMARLVGERYFAAFSGAVELLILTQVGYLQIICLGLALLHLVAERLYQGRTLRQFWWYWLAGLGAVTLLGASWVLPDLSRSQRRAHASNLTTEAQEAAQRDYQLWYGVLSVLQLASLAGGGAYFWRLAQAQDQPRFISSTKFRS